MLLQGQAVIDLLPQKPPMVMIDSLLEVDEMKCKTSFTIKEGHLFCVSGKFEAAGLIENMAQTAAIQSGYMAQQQQEKPPIGFIAGIKRLEINGLPKVGESIETVIEMTQQVFNIRLIIAQIYVHQELLASCEMKISVQEK